MFSKKHKHIDEGGKGLRNPSILSVGLKVIGNLESEGEIQVDGLVEGDIKCKLLVVGVNGTIKGKIYAETLRVRGSIEGEVNAVSIFFASTARVIGNISHESVAMEPGAFIDGSYHRKEVVVDLKGSASNSKTFSPAKFSKVSGKS